MLFQTLDGGHNMHANCYIDETLKKLCQFYNNVIFSYLIQ